MTTSAGTAGTSSELARSSLVVNALSVDVEDYFQVSAFETHIARSEWDAIPRRVEAHVDRLLVLLERSGARATFFTLGWIAERHPGMVRRIAGAGHEVGSHGYAHCRATRQSRDEFHEDIVRAKGILEAITGVEVVGYRAPSFSIGTSNPWAFDCIAQAGYRYSSSVYPIRHDHYGTPNAQRFPHEPVPGLLEVPVATVRAWNRNWPAGGGGYFRLLPYRLSSWSIRRINLRERRPAMFYVHPWELDHEQPRVPGTGTKTRFRHYVNLHRTEPRLARLLADFRWDRADRVFLHGTE